MNTALPADDEKGLFWMHSTLTRHGWNSQYQNSMDHVRCVLNLIQFPKIALKLSLCCLVLIKSIHLENWDTSIKRKTLFLNPSWHILSTSTASESFTLLSCSLLHGRCPFSRSHWDHMGPSSLSLSLQQAHCLPRPCHTWVQKIKEPCSAYNHTAAARAKLPSLLHQLCFQHMCFQGWPLILHLCALFSL